VCPLGIDAGGEKSAIDGDALAGNKGSRVGGEENSGADDLMRLAETVHGCAKQDFAAAFGAGKQVGIQLGGKDAGWVFAMSAAVARRPKS